MKSILHKTSIILLLFSICRINLQDVQAQTTLVEWVDFFGFEPPIEETYALAMNDGRELSGSGQSAPDGVPTLFITSAPWDFEDMIFSSNGWNVGAGVANFNFNFATTNYNSVEVSFLFGIFSEFGPRNFKAQYSTSSSTGPWTDLGSEFSYLGTIPTTGLSSTETFTLPTSCDNQTNVWIRIVTTDGSLLSGYTAGPFIDNVVVNGTAMSEASITAQPDDVTICEGTETSFSVTAINAVSYQWEYRTSSSGTFTNVVDDATYDDVNTSTLTVNNVTSSMNGYEYRCRVTGGIPPDAISDAALLTVNAYGTWNGLVNSSWDNTANWDCGTIPGSSTNVTILASAPNHPLISDGVNAICNDITIESGAELSIEGSGSLEILGTPTISAGSLSAEDGEVIFSGSLDQNIPSGTYKLLQIDGGSSKNLTGDISISGQLQLNSGWLVMNDYDVTLHPSSTISGGSNTSFVVSNGPGQLIRQNIGSGGTTGNIPFPLGSNTGSYSPLILNNSGTADDFSVSVIDGIFESYTGSDGVDQMMTGAVDKTWFVSEAVAGGSNASIQLSWSEEDELPDFDRDNCLFSHYNGTGWEPQELSTALGFDPYFISGSGITSFSPFAVASEGAPLSVNLLSFEGKNKGAYNELRWKTTDEADMDSYILEKSIDSKSWEDIGKLNARNEIGIQEYEYLDQANQSSFYRLKMIEQNSRIHYSAVLHVQVHHPEFRIFPNPIEQSFIIQYSNIGNTTLYLGLTNLEGKTVFEKTIPIKNGSNECAVNIPHLPCGPYYYQIKMGPEHFTGMIIKK